MAPVLSDIGEVSIIPGLVVLSFGGAIAIACAILAGILKLAKDPSARNFFIAAITIWIITLVLVIVTLCVAHFYYHLDGP